MDNGQSVGLSVVLAFVLIRYRGPAARVAMRRGSERLAELKCWTLIMCGYRFKSGVVGIVGNAAKMRQILDALDTWWSSRCRPIIATCRIPVEVRTLEPRRMLSGLTGSSWTAIGPASISGSGFGGQVSGRVTGIATSPTDANTYYIAAAGGGVWKTTNAGGSWTPLTDNQATLAMGAIAVSPANGKVIYAATGEANNSGDSQTGRGILVSQDGGTTWTLTGATALNGTVVARIVADPTNAGTAYTTATQWTGGTAGIYKTTNFGATWTQVFTVNDSSAQYTDLVVDPTSSPTSRTIFAAIGTAFGNTNNGLYKSTDGGTTWAKVAAFPSGTGDGRITLAMAPSDHKTMYASISDSSTFGLLGIYKTTDGGVSWSQMKSAPNYMGGQGWYDQVLIVNPTNANIVFAGGQYAYGGSSPNGFIASTDGGTSWTEIGNPIHPDHHAAAFDAAGRLVEGNDGGVFRLDTANNINSNWTNLNSNLNITQFTGIALHPTNVSIAYGGSQDNGTEKYTGSTVWNAVQGGDGGFVRVDPNNPNTVYHTFYYFGDGFLERSDDGGVTWNGKTNGIITTDNRLPDPETNPARFYPPYVIDGANSSRLVLGTNTVYVSANRGDTWTAVSTPGAGAWSVVSASVPIDSVAALGSTIYAAAGGRVFVTSNNGASWTATTPASSTNFSFEDIYVVPGNASEAFAVTGQETNGQHVFFTKDAGATWTNLSGDLPNYAGHAVRYDPGTDRLWVGTDHGVYVDSGAVVGGKTHWTTFVKGLPNVQIVGLEFNSALNVLAAGTHGRGMWEISTLNNNVSTTGTNAVTVNYIAQTNTLLISGDDAPNNITVSRVNGVLTVTMTPFKKSDGTSIGTLNGSTALKTTFGAATGKINLTASLRNAADDTGKILGDSLTLDGLTLGTVNINDGSGVNAFTIKNTSIDRLLLDGGNVQSTLKLVGTTSIGSRSITNISSTTVTPAVTGLSVTPANPTPAAPNEKPVAITTVSRARADAPANRKSKSSLNVPTLPSLE